MLRIAKTFEFLIKFFTKTAFLAFYYLQALKIANFFRLSTRFYSIFLIRYIFWRDYCRYKHRFILRHLLLYYFLLHQQYRKAFGKDIVKRFSLFTPNKTFYVHVRENQLLIFNSVETFLCTTTQST